MPIQWEQYECETFADYLRLRNIKFAHIANESGMRLPMGVIRKRARMGYGKGIPDYLIVLHDKLLFIEMKREKGGSISPEQKEWIEILNKNIGVIAAVCKGANEAIDLVEKILKEEKPNRS